ncbi:hypothetical protein BGZ63DRAFT_403666 [Mariannaea sp. PMI_226]|nr:hypothetical protein BGZ63DRAFT_403666 [Mariannaea sp. PMI_226]
MCCARLTFGPLFGWVGPHQPISSADGRSSSIKVLVKAQGNSQAATRQPNKASSPKQLTSPPICEPLVLPGFSGLYASCLGIPATKTGGSFVLGVLVENFALLRPLRPHSPLTTHHSSEVVQDASIFDNSAILSPEKSHVDYCHILAVRYPYQTKIALLPLVLCLYATTPRNFRTMLSGKVVLH